MTPSSNRPLNKVYAGAIGAAVSAIVLALIKNYLWVGMPADLEGPVNTLIAAFVIGGISGFAGWITPIAPGEIVDNGQPPVVDQQPAQVKP